VTVASVIHIFVVMMADWARASTIQNSNSTALVRKILAILLALIAVWLFVSSQRAV
jgi:hypothetical protein